MLENDFKKNLDWGLSDSKVGFSIRYDVADGPEMSYGEKNEQESEKVTIAF